MAVAGVIVPGMIMSYLPVRTCTEPLPVEIFLLPLYSALCALSTLQFCYQKQCVSKENDGLRFFIEHMSNTRTSFMKLCM